MTRQNGNQFNLRLAQGDYPDLSSIYENSNKVQTEFIRVQIESGEMYSKIALMFPKDAVKVRQNKEAACRAYNTALRFLLKSTLPFSKLNELRMRLVLLNEDRHKLIMFEERSENSG